RSVDVSGGLLVPVATDGATMPVVSRKSHRVLLVDTAAGSASPAAPLNATGELGRPALLGTRVYLPDQATGRLIVFGTRTGRLHRGGGPADRGRGQVGQPPGLAERRPAVGRRPEQRRGGRGRRGRDGARADSALSERR